MRVFPARAGMSRNQFTQLYKTDGVPRASGDEPVEKESREIMAKCSPRERG